MIRCLHIIHKLLGSGLSSLETGFQQVPLVQSWWNFHSIVKNYNNLKLALKFLAKKQKFIFLIELKKKKKKKREKKMKKKWFTIEKYSWNGQGTAYPLDGRPQKEVQVRPDRLEVVASFCYLGDMLSAADGCELSTTTCVNTAWKKFKELLPVLSSLHLSFKTCGHVYSSCVRSAMLHASETWPLTKSNLQHLQRNDRAMIGQICNVRPQDIVPSGPMSYLCNFALRIWTSFWRREDSDGMDMWNAPVVQSFDIQVEGKHGPWRPKMTWKQLTKRDCREWKL